MTGGIWPQSPAEPGIPGKKTSPLLQEAVGGADAAPCYLQNEVLGISEGAWLAWAGISGGTLGVLSVLEVISELMLLKVPCHSSPEHDALGPAMLGSLHAALPGSVWYRGCLRTFLCLWVLFPNYWLMGCIRCDSFSVYSHSHDPSAIWVN